MLVFLFSHNNSRTIPHRLVINLFRNYWICLKQILRNFILLIICIIVALLTWCMCLVLAITRHVFLWIQYSAFLNSGICGIPWNSAGIANQGWTEGHGEWGGVQFWTASFNLRGRPRGWSFPPSRKMLRLLICTSVRWRHGGWGRAQHKSDGGSPSPVVLRRGVLCFRQTCVKRE